MGQEQDGYTKACGIGVQFHAETDQGIQVKLMKSAVATPAAEAGLKDGDVLHAVHMSEGWQPFRTRGDFERLLDAHPEMPITLRVIRGHPLRSKAYIYSGTPSEDAPGHYINIDAVEMLDFELVREALYPNLPEGGVQDLMSIPFRTWQDMLECVPMVQGPVESVDITDVAEAVLPQALANNNVTASAQPSVV